MREVRRTHHRPRLCHVEYWWTFIPQDHREHVAGVPPLVSANQANGRSQDRIDWWVARRAASVAGDPVDVEGEDPSGRLVVGLHAIAPHGAVAAQHPQGDPQSLTSDASRSKLLRYLAISNPLQLVHQGAKIMVWYREHCASGVRPDGVPLSTDEGQRAKLIGGPGSELNRACEAHAAQPGNRSPTGPFTR